MQSHGELRCNNVSGSDILTTHRLYFGEQKIENITFFFVLKTAIKDETRAQEKRLRSDWNT